MGQKTRAERRVMPGMPYRLPRPAVPTRRPEDKVRLTERCGTDSARPAKVRVDVDGGRHGTAAVLRAQRVAREIEEGGGSAEITEVAPERSRLVAELDGTQATKLARHRFIRSIESVG